MGACGLLMGPGHWKRLCVRLCISGIQRRRISGRPRPFHRQPAGCSPCRSLSHFHELKLHRAVHRIESLGKHYYIYLHMCVRARGCLCPFSPNIDTQSHFQQQHQGFFFSLSLFILPLAETHSQRFVKCEWGVWKHQTADEGIFVCASRNRGLLLKFRQQ